MLPRPDHTMKMKHCDMPLQTFISPQNSQATKVTGGSVAQHIQKFLLSQETADSQIIEIPAIKEYNSGLQDRHKPKPRSTSNQNKVRFDIKNGLMDLIRETGIDITTIRDRSEGNRPQTTRAQLKVKPLPFPSEKEAIRLALNYKREVIQKQKRSQQSSSDREQEQPQIQQPCPVPQPILVEENQKKDQKQCEVKAGTIARRQKNHKECSSTSSRENLTTISQAASEDHQHFVKPQEARRFQPGQILRQTRSASRLKYLSPIEPEPRFQPMIIASKPPIPRRVPSPFHKSPEDCQNREQSFVNKLSPKQARHVQVASLKQLVRMSQVDLQESVSVILEKVPKAKQQLHLQLRHPQNTLQVLRQNLKVLAIEKVVPNLQEISQLKQRIEHHSTLLLASPFTQQEQLKHHIVQDIIARLTQKLVIAHLRMYCKFRQQLRQLFDSYYRLTYQQPLFEKCLNKWKQHFVSVKERSQQIEQYIETVQAFKLSQLFQQWRQGCQVRRSTFQRNQEIIHQYRLKRQNQVIKAFQAQVIELKIKKLGKMIADRMRVYRLRWCVFASWCASHRNGSKIKRIALQRMNCGAADLAFSQNSQQKKSLLDSRSHFIQTSENAKQLLMTEIEELQRQKCYLTQRLHCQPNQQQYFQLATISRRIEVITPEQHDDDDITQLLRPQLYMRMTNQQQDEEALDQKYSIHHLLVQHQNQLKLRDAQSEDSDQNTTTQELPLPAQIQRYKAPPNQLFTKLQGQLSIKPLPQQQIVQQIQNLNQMIHQASKLDNQSYHRSQALYMQFKQHLSAPSQQGISFTEYANVIQQAGASFTQLNKFQKQSCILLKWKIQYLKKVLYSNLNLLSYYNKQKQFIKAWFQQIKTKKRQALQFYELKRVQNFYQLFQNWCRETRYITYHQLKAVRQFKLRFVLKYWRKYLGKSELQKNKDQAVMRFRAHQLLTKALVSFYAHKLKSQRVKQFQRKQCYLKFFKRKWLPQSKKSQFLRKVFEKAQLRCQQSERSRYSQQFELMKQRFDTWRLKVQEREELIKNYMALNHYKLLLQVKAFNRLRSLRQQHYACEILVTVFQRKVASTFDSLRVADQLQQTLCTDYQHYRSRVLIEKVVKEWHQYTVQNKIAKMFFKRKYLRALQEHVLLTNYDKPQRHHCQRLKVIAFYTLRDVKLQRWQKERDEIFNRAVAGKYETNLKRKCITALVNQMLKQKRKRIIEQTVVEFRDHSLVEKALNFWKLYHMLKRRQKLQSQVADEFRDDILKRKLYKGSLEMTLVQGKLVTKNHELQQRIINILKAQCKMHLEGKLQQILKAKAQIKLVRCFLSWRSIAKFEQSESAPSAFQTMTPSPFKAKSLVQTTDDKHGLTDDKRGMSSMQESSLDMHYKMLISQDASSMTPSPAPLQRMSKFSPDMFCQTSNSQSVHSDSTKKQFQTSGAVSVQSGLFGELDQIYKQQQQWSKDQDEREKVLKQMQLQYQSLKSSL